MTLPRDLKDGYRRFRRSGFADQAQRYRALAAHGQSPNALVIACCDSRADPALIFDARPGELFVLRNVANLVPPAETDASYHGTSAALEFAVTVLEVGHIVVLGHGRCGGVEAARRRTASGGPGGYLGRWISLLDPVCEQLKDRQGSEAALQRLYEEAGVRLSLERLRSFDFIAARLDSGHLQLHGAHFDIASGRLSVLARDSGEFAELPGDQ